MTKAPCIEFDCDKLSYGNGKCKGHYMKDYRQTIKKDGYIPIRGEGERVTRRDYNSIDPELLWQFVKRELNLK